jgi:hypothetical protein
MYYSVILPVYNTNKDCTRPFRDVARCLHPTEPIPVARLRFSGPNKK